MPVKYNSQQFAEIMFNYLKPEDGYAMGKNVFIYLIAGTSAESGML